MFNNLDSFFSKELIFDSLFSSVLSLETEILEVN